LFQAWIKRWRNVAHSKSGHQKPSDAIEAGLWVGPSPEITVAHVQAVHDAAHDCEEEGTAAGRENAVVCKGH
jgi:hypothetical protein